MRAEVLSPRRRASVLQSSNIFYESSQDYLEPNEMVRIIPTYDYASVDNESKLLLLLDKEEARNPLYKSTEPNHGDEDQNSTCWPPLIVHGSSDRVRVWEKDCI